MDPWMEFGLDHSTEFRLDHSMDFHLDRLTEFCLDTLTDRWTEFHLDWSMEFCDLMFYIGNWNKINSGLGSQSPSNEGNNQKKLGIGLIVSNEKQQEIVCVGRRHNCWADLGIEQQILCVSHRRNCWVVLIKREQDN